MQHAHDMRPSILCMFAPKLCMLHAHNFVCWIAGEENFREWSERGCKIVSGRGKKIYMQGSVNYRKFCPQKIKQKL